MGGDFSGCTVIRFLIAFARRNPPPSPTPRHPPPPPRWPSPSCHRYPLPYGAPVHSSDPGSSASAALSLQLLSPGFLCRARRSAACTPVRPVGTSLSTARNCAIVESTYSPPGRPFSGQAPGQLPGIHQHHFQSVPLQYLVRRNPVHSRAFHCHRFDVPLLQPCGHPF